MEDMSDSYACEELQSLCAEMGYALVSLRSKWEPLLADAPDDPKIQEIDEKCMRPLKIDCLQLIRSLLNLANALNDPLMSKVVS